MKTTAVNAMTKAGTQEKNNRTVVTPINWKSNGAILKTKTSVILSVDAPALDNLEINEPVL